MTSTSKHYLLSFDKTTLLLSALVSGYFIVTVTLNVYRYAIAGAVAELLWLPMMLLLVALPLVALYGWWKARFSIRSLHLYSLLVMVVSIAALLLLSPAA